MLFVATKGLEQTGLIQRIAEKIEQGKFIPTKLIAFSFFLSMFLTNDVALVVLVPLTLSLRINRKGLLVILEALAANAGSGLMPFGNPQNLFIYWFYNIPPLEFIKVMIPFSCFFFGALLLVARVLKIEVSLPEKNASEKIDSKAFFYATFFLFILLGILHFIPLYWGLLVLPFALFFDQKALRIDYLLLLLFFFFFGLTEYLNGFFSDQKSISSHVFLFSTLSSQFLSNVPTALLFAKFTENWKALLWGVNTGGFGSLFASMANLIAYRIYLDTEGREKKTAFTAQFLIWGYGAWFLALALYFVLYGKGGL